MRKLAAAAAAFFVVCVAGCATADSTRSLARGESLDDVTNGLVSGASAGNGDESGRVQAELGRRPTTSSPSPLVAAMGDQAGGTRLLVYTGNVAVEVVRPEEAVAALVQMATEWGGYLSQREDASVTVRVPAAKFDAAMAAVRGMGRVLGESLRADDVTKQHTDLGIRLDNARRARERLTALLAKAEKVEDLLKIEEQLRRVTEEIERMEGELKFLDDQVAMAALTVHFHASAEVVPQQRREGSRFAWINRVGVEHVRRGF
jgi:hypothetical protein